MNTNKYENDFKTCGVPSDLKNMKILAIEKELMTIPKEEADAILKQEAFKVWELKEKDLVREIYFNEAHCAVLVLECADRITALNLLKDLPLVQKGYITFELMELHPYTGFQRLF